MKVCLPPPLKAECPSPEMQGNQGSGIDFIHIQPKEVSKHHTAGLFSTSSGASDFNIMNVNDVEIVVKAAKIEDVKVKHEEQTNDDSAAKDDLD